jgi:hypothetical protein
MNITQKTTTGANMKTHQSFYSSMSTPERWLFAGNLATAVGLLCISIGTTLRLVSEGNLPSGRPIFTPPIGDPKNEPPKDGANIAKNYFS